MSSVGAGPLLLVVVDLVLDWLVVIANIETETTRIDITMSPKKESAKNGLG